MWLLLLLFSAAALHSCDSVQFPPVITKMPPKKLDYVIRESIKMECEAIGSPAPAFRWTRNDVDFDWTKNSGRYKKYPGAGTLVFIAPMEDDDGIYQCFASNDLGTAASVKVVMRRTELGRFSELDEFQFDRNVGQSLSIPCKAPNSYPEATIIWYKVDTTTGTISTLPMSNRITIDAMSGALLFSNLRLEDGNAKYKCSARNYVMRQASNGRLNRISIRNSPVYRAAELFSQNPGVQHGLVNRTLDLFCFFSGNPTPIMEWKKGDTKITTSQEWSKFQLLESGTRLRLTDIDAATHAGSYQCTGTNAKSGGLPASGTFVVDVYSEPYWIRKPTDVSVPKGGSHTFRCEAGASDGDPSWSINGRPATDYNNRTTHSGSTFTFHNLSLGDALVVQCNCSNKYGYIYANAYINVLSEPPTFVTPPTDTKAADEG